MSSLQHDRLPTPPEGTAPRVRWITTIDAHADISTLRVIALCLATIVACALSVLTVAGLSVMAAVLHLEGPGTLVVIFLLCLVALCCIWKLTFHVYDHYSHRARLARTAPRRERLARVCAHPHALQRLPHRVVEQALLADRANRPFRWLKKRNRNARLLRKIMPKLPRGLTIIIETRDMRILRDEPVISVPFEPVEERDMHDVAAFRRSAYELVGRTLPTMWDDWYETQLERGRWRRESTHEQRARRIRAYRRRYIIVGTCLCTTLLILFIWALLFRRGSLFAAMRPLWLLLPFAALLGLAGMIVFERRFLVPGGWIDVKHPFWRKRGRGLYVRRSDTPVVCKPPYWTVVLVDSQAKEVRGGLNLLAWQATAPPPSVDAVQALVGEDVELTVAG